MRRFIMNRWFAFILILAFFVAGPQASSRLHADGSPDVIEEPDSGGGGGRGDPDMPINPGRTPPTGVVKPARPLRIWGHTVGDGGAYGSIEILRFRAMLFVLRGWLLHR